jgi:hypothetical protein
MGISPMSIVRDERVLGALHSERMSPETKDPEAMSSRPFWRTKPQPPQNATGIFSHQKQNYSCSTELKLVNCSNRQFIRDPRHLSPETPASTADLVSEPDSRKPQLPQKSPCSTPAAPKICPSEMTLHHTWFDVHLLMEGP